MASITEYGMMKKDKYVKILPFDLWKDKIEFTNVGIKLKGSRSHLFSSETLIFRYIGYPLKVKKEGIGLSTREPFYTLLDPTNNNEFNVYGLMCDDNGSILDDKDFML